MCFAIFMPQIKARISYLFKIALSALVLLVLPQTVLAQSDSASVQLELFVNQVTSATGDFQQSVKTEANQTQGESQSGEFAFQRPGKFIWDVKKPYDQLVISDGSQIYQYDPDLEQVTQRSSGTAINNSPAALLFGSGSLADTFELQDLSDQDNFKWLRAIPKQKDAGFVHVDIGFSNGLPAKLNLLDSFGQTTEITFTNFKVNPELSADKFKFVVPQGVDLVKMD